MKRALVFLLVLTLALGLFALEAGAADNFPMVTMDDSKDFTVVKLTNNRESMKVVGLTSDWQKVVIESQNLIEWTTSEPNVAKFVVGQQEVNSVSGTDTVTVVMKGEGRATIKATYNNDNNKSVNSYIVVEVNAATPSVSNITTEVVGNATETFTIPNPNNPNKTVKLFSLNDVFGAAFDDADVLKKDASAMHSLLYALEYYYDSDGTDDIDDPSWDWDWVSTNVTVTTEGAFVQKIGSDENYYNQQDDKYYGWQYVAKPSGGVYADPGYASSIYELLNFRS